VRAVVKADGYNFGLERIARELDGTADGFVVSDADDLRRLRAITKAPAVTLLDRGPEHAARVVALGGIPNIAHRDSLAALAARSDAASLTVRAGLRLAAGWSAIELDEAAAYARMLAQSGMRVELWTHLTNPENEKADRERFARFVAVFSKTGVHIAGEDVESTFPAANGATHATNVRIGVGLFGAGSSQGVTGLQCAIVVSAPVVETLASKGDLRASYSEHALPQGVQVTVVRCGYRDGFPRVTRPYRNILSVGMQNTVVLGHANGDAFTLLGTDDDLDELASAAGVLPHQVVTSFGMGAGGRLHID
jgi:alanine racemase